MTDQQHNTASDGSASETISYGFLVAKAWPIILANAAVPLLGLVDTAVIGNVAGVADLGAIAFGALIFSFLYWGFGFLRMSTTGFVAEAAGSRNWAEVRVVLVRALLLGLMLGAGLLVLQLPILFAAMSLLSGSEAVETLASDYFSIRIWGAPATLATFALMGVLIGLGKSKLLLLTQLFLNLFNIVLDVLFAGVLGWGVEGIALGTVIAEWSMLLFALFFTLRELRVTLGVGQAFISAGTLWRPDALNRMLTSNGNIMVRTLLLIFSFAFFVDQSARYGEVTLAANHILLQIIAFAAFFLDGYAFVAESLVGQAKGAHDGARFELAVRKSTLLAALTAAILALLVLVGGETLVLVLTVLEPVRVQSLDLLWLAALYIVCSFAAFQLDGIFIGMAATREMRNAAILSIGAFLAFWALGRSLGMVGLWLAMIGYVIARALALLLYYPRLRRSVLKVETRDVQ